MTTRTETTHLWTNETLLPDEHRIYRLAPQVGVMKGTIDVRGLSHRLRDDERGLWAVADGSGRYPDQTDDGVLWLDFTTSIMLGQRYDNTIHVPLVNHRDGKACTFVTTAAGLLVLSDMFRWTMNADGKLYRVVRW
jgi:hypothetical protein